MHKFHFVVKGTETGEQQAALPPRPALGDAFDAAVLEATVAVRKLMAEPNSEIAALARAFGERTKSGDSKDLRTNLIVDLLRSLASGAPESRREFEGKAAAAIQNVEEAKRDATRRLALASLDLAVQYVRSAVLDRKVDRPLDALFHFSAAARQLTMYLPPENELMTILGSEINKLKTLPAFKAAVDHHLIHRPEVTLNQKGFEVAFRFPILAGEYPAMPSEDELRDYLLELTGAAEQEWAGRCPSVRAYNDSTSHHSVRNSSARGGPKLIDPQGTFRGRISSNTCGRDSITNTVSRFGSTTSCDSIFNSTAAAHRLLLGGTWKIVADQS